MNEYARFEEDRHVHLNLIIQELQARLGNLREETTAVSGSIVPAINDGILNSEYVNTLNGMVWNQRQEIEDLTRAVDELERAIKPLQD